MNSSKLLSIVKKDVSWRFLNLQGDKIPLYEYEKGQNFLLLKHKKQLCDFSDILYESINFRWTQILENFNSSPRIAKKVRIMDLERIKRTNLNRFRPYLDRENYLKICFICGKEIKNETPSIDHVIPWSFMYSDDLWNLVYTHKSCNSSKSNIIPDEKQIQKLEKRNLRLLLELINDDDLAKKKSVKELELAIERNFVRKFWVNCR